MCKICEDNQSLDYVTIEYCEKGYELVIQTSDFGDYYDDWVYERVNIKYCPFCGRKLGGIKC